MSDRNLNDLSAEMKPLAQEFLTKCNADPLFTAQGITVFVDQTYRSEADQNADYAKGRTTPGAIITNAQYGQSPHNCVDSDGNPAAKAFDIAIEDSDGSLDWDATDPLWRRAIKIGESLGLVSGSEFHSLKDNPHFELADWKQ